MYIKDSLYYCSMETKIERLHIQQSSHWGVIAVVDTNRDSHINHRVVKLSQAGSTVVLEHNKIPELIDFLNSIKLG